MKRLANSGQTVIGTLIAAALMAIIMMAFSSMVKIQTWQNRKIAARGGVNDLSHAMDTLFGSPRCANSGSFSYLGNPAVVVVSGTDYELSLDMISFSNGAPIITSLPNQVMAQMIGPYSIATPGILMASVGISSTNGSGYQFPFQIKVSFSSPNGAPPLPILKTMTVFTDSTYKVIGACYSAQGGLLSAFLGNQDSTQALPHNLGTIVRYDRVIQDEKVEYNPLTGEFVAKGAGVFQVNADFAVSPSISWISSSFCKGYLVKNWMAPSEVTLSVNAQVMEPTGNGCHVQLAGSITLLPGEKLVVVALVVASPAQTYTLAALQGHFSVVQLR